MDPLLELPAENEFEYYSGAENPSLLVRGTDWVRSLRKGKFAKRVIKVFGENINGKSVFLPRYLTPQKPPVEVCDLVSNPEDEYAIEKVARFVMLLPFIEDNRAFEDLPDLWCTSQEFLDMGGGDYEEHAILLCNYFNYIDSVQRRPEIKSYLVLGRGMPEGYTSYVLRMNTNTRHVELWNATRGEAYYFGREDFSNKCLCFTIASGYRMNFRNHDPTCQLKELGCLVSDENVYANIQNTGDPSMLNFDLDNRKYWRPFLDVALRRHIFEGGAIDTIQPEIIYTPPSPDNRELELRIRTFISQHF